MINNWRHIWCYPIILKRLHQRIVVTISVYAVRGVANAISIDINSGVVAPVVAQVARVYVAAVGVGRLFGRVPSVR